MSEITTTTMREVTVRALICDGCQDQQYIPESDPRSGWDIVELPTGWYRLQHIPQPDFHEYSDFCSRSCLALWVASNR